MGLSTSLHDRGQGLEKPVTTAAAVSGMDCLLSVNTMVVYGT